MGHHVAVSGLRRSAQGDDVLRLNGVIRPAKRPLVADAAVRKRLNAKAPTQVADFFMPLFDQVFHRMAGGVGVADQNAVECDGIAPAVEQNQVALGIAEQLKILLRHFRAEKNHRGAGILQNAMYLLRAVGAAAVDIAEHGFKLQIFRLTLHSLDHSRKKWTVVDNQAVLFINDKFDFGYSGLYGVPNLLRSLQNTFHRLLVDPSFMVQRI